MIETFTSKFTKPLAKDMSIYDDLLLNAEDKLFYAMLQEPLDELLKQPSSQSVDFVLTFSKTHKAPND